MQVKDHLLYINKFRQVEHKETPNHGGVIDPEFLVMHYTAVTTKESTDKWFLNPVAKASAHLLIGRDGSITQFAPFNIKTWHAGQSYWDGRSNLNAFSISIELVNGGRLTKKGESWICPVDKKEVAEDDLILAIHKNESIESWWQEYTEVQLEITLEIAALLVQTYNLKDVLGHEDIAPIRKSDPGPAFPMSSFRSRAMGRENHMLDLFVTSDELNIRSGPGTTFQLLSSPLPEGTEVKVLKRTGNWSFVEVLNKIHGLMDLEGWVSTRYLIKK